MDRISALRLHTDLVHYVDARITATGERSERITMHLVTTARHPLPGWITLYGDCLGQYRSITLRDHETVEVHQ